MIMMIVGPSWDVRGTFVGCKMAETVEGCGNHTTVKYQVGTTLVSLGSRNAVEKSK